MAEIKTKEHDKDVYEFINEFVATEQKKLDSYELIKIIEELTGFKAKMWGDSIIGFGKYHYKSERSKQEGDWPLIGFSSRKAALSLYIYCGGEYQDELLKKFGKFTMGKACIYVKKLSDINIDIFKQLVTTSIEITQAKYK